jgi:predicted enzyme related to lactoylglutathione lyase
MENISMANRISWFEILGGDANRLHSFYSKLFGWNIDANNEMKYGMVSDKDAGIGGGIGPNPAGGEGYVTIYVGVDDIKASMAKVEALGGKTVMPPTELPEFHLTFALFSDPEGHVIGMTQNS